MKLSKQLKTQESRTAEASKETEQALQDKAVIEEALELERTRMQIQLAQFTKLVDYRHNTPNAAKKRNNPKKVLYIVVYCNVLYCIVVCIIFSLFLRV